MNTTMIDTKAVTLRHFEPTEEDYALVIAVQNAVFPDRPDSVAYWKELDAKRPKRVFFQRLVIEHDGQVIGQANYREDTWAHRPGKYWFSLDILPDFQQQGIEQLVYEYIMQALSRREAPPTEMFVEIREDKTALHEFLTALGYAPIMRFPMSRIAIPEFDAEKHRAKVEAVENSPIQIKTLAELAAIQPDWQQRLYDLDELLSQDVPMFEPITFPTLEEYVDRFINRPVFLPEGCFVALDGDEWVGISELVRDHEDTTLLYTGLTGVRREYRRQGLATALKVKALLFARSIGALRVETDNEENNPMFQINLQLGFKPIPAWVEYRKVLAPNGTNQAPLSKENE